MTEPRFLQIHFLAPYTAALLNRDDSGLAKRLPYGGTLRTRVSSQCQKFHWRHADDVYALKRLAKYSESDRSRSLVDKIIGEAIESGVSEGVAKALGQWFNFAVYSGKADEKPKKLGAVGKTDEKEGRPTLLFGEPEMRWIKSEFLRLAREACGNPEQAFSLGDAWVGLAKKGRSEFQKNREKNLEVLRATGDLPAGMTAALFGRMVTSDPKANIDAPVHVAHAFTVHAEEAESDYFIAADDLARDEDTGADTIQETELTSGLFYGYVVVDLPGLLGNLGGDAGLAGEVLHNLLYLIAEVSPGAKLGSTAPYSRASFLMVEAGDRQPRSLAEAFRESCPANTATAVGRLADHLAALDAAYATGEARRVMSLANAEVPGAARGSLMELAAFVHGLPGQLPERAA
jgi:CRISPR system Cascade subunit CasC